MGKTLKTDSLRERFGVSEESVAQRRAFVRLGDRERELIESLIPWAEGIADEVSHEFYEWQFGFAPTRRFFENIATHKGTSLSDLRVGLERTHAQYWREVFQGARQNWDAAYYEKRLRVGKVHDRIDLPMKWYLGAYTEFTRLARKHLSDKFEADFVLDALEALQRVFNFDMQAVGDAYTLSLFESVGVDISALPAPHGGDRSESIGEAKAMITGTVKEVARLAPELESAASSLTEVSTQLGQGADQTNEQVSHAAASASMVSGSIDMVAAATQQMGSAINEIAESANSAAQHAEKGVLQGNKAKTLLDKLATSGEEIGKAMRLITGIADQTNLLALNATITAARAGSAGRGFGVVASEVKELSRGTARAADEISVMVNSVQEDVSAAAAALTQMIEVITQISHHQTSVAGAVQEQSATTEEISRSVAGAASAANEIADTLNRVSQVSESARNAADHTGVSAQQLNQMAQALTHAVRQLTLPESQAMRPAKAS